MGSCLLGFIELHSETSPYGHLSSVVTYDIALSMDSPEMFVDVLYTF